MFKLAILIVFLGVVLASLVIHLTEDPSFSPPPPPQHATEADTCNKAPRVRQTNRSDDLGVEMRERFDPEGKRPGLPRAPHGKKVFRLSHRRVEESRKRLFYAAPDDVLEMAALVRSFQLLSLVPRERRPEKSCLKRASTKKKKKRKSQQSKHVHFPDVLNEYLEIPCVNWESGLQDLGPTDDAGDIDMIDVDWHHSVYLEVINDPSSCHKRYYKAAILSGWMFE